MATKRDPSGDVSRLRRRQEELRAAGVRYCLSAYTDVHGVPKCKAVPIDHFEAMMAGSELFTGAALDGLGQGPNDDELSVRPDLDSIVQLPWSPEVAWAPGSLHYHDQPWPMDSRNVLKRQLARAAKLGYRFNLGIETEFYLLASDTGRPAPFNPANRLAKSAYDVRFLLEGLGFLDEMIGYMNGMGWDVHSFDHEDARSQYEFDFSYTDALTMADRFTLWKIMGRQVAAKYGATFSVMPKPFSDATGTGAHLNMSLAELGSGKNLFEDPKDPHKLGSAGYHWTAGILGHASAMCAICSPTVNSYKRLIKGGSITGYTWAPIFATFGDNNRTNMMRIPLSGGRVECRSADGSMNLYLAAAFALAAGLDGIERKLDPGPPTRLNMYEMSGAELSKRGIKVLPRNLLEAVEAFDKDPFCEQVLGKDLKDAFVQLKRQEWEDYHNSISQWEVDRYLTMF